MARLGFELETQSTDGEGAAYYDYEEDAFPRIEGLATVEDCSVDGFEFRTTRGETYDRCDALLTELFKRDHSIDRGCSFHVHFSLPGVRHRWGADTQRRLIGAVLMLLDKVPLSVLKRWDYSTNWFYLKVEAGKGPFVSSRSEVGRNGTWEFRCWGNTQDKATAMTCLDLTLEAAAVAYDPEVDIIHWNEDAAKGMIRAEIERRRAALEATATTQTAVAVEGESDVA